MVVSQVNPDGEDADGMEPVVIKLNRVGTRGIIRILNILERDLRTSREISRTALVWEELKQKIRSYSDLIAAIVNLF